jgi:hypothetical protein
VLRQKRVMIIFRPSVSRVHRTQREIITLSAELEKELQYNTSSQLRASWMGVALEMEIVRVIWVADMTTRKCCSIALQGNEHSPCCQLLSVSVTDLCE